MNSVNLNKTEILNKINDLENDQTAWIERGMHSSLASVNSIRDFLNVLDLCYRHDTDAKKLIELHYLLFNDGTLTHFDEMLTDVADTIDIVLSGLIDARDNDK